MNLIPFSLKIPEGWKVANQKYDSNSYWVMILSPIGLKSVTSIEMDVQQFAAEPEVDPKQLKNFSYVNLIGNNADILEEKMGNRHGAISHECLFKKDLHLYGRSFCFVVSGYIFMIKWQSSDPKVFRQYQPTVEMFVNSIEFQNQEKENH